MELLIELLVWMFKAFFGDPEKTVDTTRLNRRPPVRPLRGPLTYGDEPAAPKTLEEILEEARRQAAERRGELMRPSQPMQPQFRRAVPDSTPETSPQPVRTLVARPLEDDEPRPFQPISQLPRPIAPPVLPPPQARQRPARRPTQILQPEAAPLIPPPPPEAPKRAGPKDKLQKAQIYAIPDLLQAIRTAPSADKRDAARQAVVMLEILGPPRSRRGFHRPGARMF